MLLIDLKNAFNMVDRSKVRACIREVAPEATAWTDFCYEGSSNVLLGAHRLTSERGVQQGDPMGPALFSLAIHEAVLACAKSATLMTGRPLDWMVFPG